MKAADAEQATATHAPDGWTPDQLDALSPELADGVARLVRFHNARGIRVRATEIVSKKRDAVRVEVLDERGQRLTLRRGDHWPEALMVADHGLAFAAQKDEDVGTLTVAAALPQGDGEPREVSAPTRRARR